MVGGVGALPRLRAVRWHPVPLSAAVAAAMLVPIVVWGVLARGAVVEDIARRDGEQRLLTARLAAGAISAAVAEAGRRLDLVASREGLRSALAARDAPQLEPQLAVLRRGTGYATTLALDPSGRLLARDPSAPETYGQSFADRDYHAGALRARGAYLSEAVVSRINGQALVVAALAVRDGERVLGLLLATLTPAQLLDQIRPLDARAGRELHLVDQRSRVIASTDDHHLPLSEMQIAGDRLQRSGSAVGVFDGMERVVTHTPITGAPWTLFVSDDASVALAAQHELDQRLIAGALGTMVLALAAAAMIAYLFTTVTRQRQALADREAALARTNADLETASRHKSEFLASMSHELRTPLNAILGFSDLLREQLATSLADRQKRYLQNIHDAGDHLLGLINDVLDLSKVEAGRVELRPVVTTLAELTDPVLASTRAAADARGVSFRPTVEGTVGVSVDPSRVRQILYNLLSNAVKFTPPGGEVRLGVAAKDRDVLIEVADTGVGIPADKRDRVFGTFERLHEGRSDAPGTGIGLALTKRLVELQGGSITFDSAEGAGTTFRVVLRDVTKVVGAGDRVLVVEDDRRDADLIVAVAGAGGLATEVVGSFSGALAAIRRAVPLAVVLDLRLPDGRGEDVLVALKSDPRTRAVPVIVVTVEDDEGTSRTNGADDHITKPIDHARLDRWLRRVAAKSVEVAVAPAAG